MSGTRLLVCGVALMITLFCVVSAVQDNTTVTNTNAITDRAAGGKDKKVDNMVNDMYTAFMMTKNMMSMMLMFVSPIIQIKGFGLSVINTLINIGRFLLQMQSTKRLHEMAEMHHVHMKAHVPQHMEPVRHHKIHHEAPTMDHDGPVYIVKDHDDQDLWGDHNNNHDHKHDFTNEHETIWAKEPDTDWKSAEHVFSAPNHDQRWSSSQKFAYYALPPATPFSSRLGEPLPASASPQHNLPPAHASYVSGNIVRQLNPHFSPNASRLR